MKKAAAGVILLLVLGALGYFLGPTLYQHFSASTAQEEGLSQQAQSERGVSSPGMTPWGRITQVEAMDVFQDEGMGRPIRPLPGHRLWVVRVDHTTIPPPPPTAGNAPASPEVLARGNVEESFLVDTTGEKHPFHWGRLAARSKAADDPGWVTFNTYVELMVYSVPRDRQPRSLQLGDGSQVDLP